MVLVKNLKFRQWFFLGSFLLKKVFGDVLYRKLAFFDRKNIDIKKTQNLYFSKGVFVHGFGQKFQIGLFFRFKQIWPTKIVW